MSQSSSPQPSGGSTWEGIVLGAVIGTAATVAWFHGAFEYVVAKFELYALFLAGLATGAVFFLALVIAFGRQLLQRLLRIPNTGLSAISSSLISLIEAVHNGKKDAAYNHARAAGAQIGASISWWALRAFALSAVNSRPESAPSFWIAKTVR